MATKSDSQSPETSSDDGVGDGTTSAIPPSATASVLVPSASESTTSLISGPSSSRQSTMKAGFAHPPGSLPVGGGGVTVTFATPP
jgi:hypothetical protein